MTNSWEELNSPRSAPQGTDPDQVGSTDVEPNSGRDPFQLFLVAAVGIVAIGGALMAFGGVGDSPDAEVPAQIAAQLPLDETSTTAAPTTAVTAETPTSAHPEWANLLDSEQASVYRLYVAAFGRAPDRDGFDHWTDLLRNGKTLQDVAASFTWTEEFQQQFGSRTEPHQIIESLHQNLLGRAATDDELAHWLAQQFEGMSVAQLMVLFAESDQSVEATGTTR